MAFGLFGKVPQKRDFMSVNMPSAVLSPFETWLQSAVAASRNELGQAWQDHYLVAPIWRFWIGEHILGTTVAGALMPSVDQVGRYFPLSIMYFAEPGDTLPPPLVSPLDHWYAAIEQRLLRALSEETDAYLTTILQGLEPPSAFAMPPAPPPPAAAPPVLEVPKAVGTTAVLDVAGVEPTADAWAAPDAEPALDGEDVPGVEAAPDVADVPAEPAPAAEPAPVPEPPKTAIEDLPDTSPFDDFPPPQLAPLADGPVTLDFKGGQTIEVPAGQTLGEALAILRDPDYRHATANRSYFWCTASRSGPARIHGRQGLPDPYFLSRMILWERGPQ
jgi:type VI secretion system protein ImpM